MNFYFFGASIADISSAAINMGEFIEGRRRKIEDRNKGWLIFGKLG